MINKVIYACIFIGSVLISSVSQVMLKTSANKSHENILKEYLNPIVIVAYGMFFLSTIITVLAYRYVSLSLGPILESTGYIFVSVFGYFFLKEKMSRKKLCGMFLILIGVAVFSTGGYLFG